MKTNEEIIEEILNKNPEEEDIFYSEAWDMIELTKIELEKEIMKILRFKTEGSFPYWDEIIVAKKRKEIRNLLRKSLKSRGTKS